MKIFHASGEEYDLTPGVTLEIERTNPFFNNYGERSLPMTLPPTEKNRRLTDFPDDLAGLKKVSQRIDATIQHNTFFSRCRQAILTGSKRVGIETSFYFNTGAFYEKIKDVSLSTIFENKIIPFASVDDAISFCQNLYVTHDERLACFPVYLEDATLNELFVSRANNGISSHPPLLNATPQTISVDGSSIYLDAGYYITPFIRANHLLEELFLYFGYTLSGNFFKKTEPFRSMVFLNNNIDTIMKGEIRYNQIVPNCMVSTMLNTYRYLYNCEFIPDEVTKTIYIRFFDEILKEKEVPDISRYVVEDPILEHPANFRQLQLKANYISGEKNQVGRNSRPIRTRYYELEAVSDSFNTIFELLKKYPDAEFDSVTGTFLRNGFRGRTSVTQIVGDIICDYYAGGILETIEKRADCLIGKVKSYSYPRNVNAGTVIPYIGSGRALNSKIIMDNAIENENEGLSTEVDTNEEELPIIPCFVGRHSSGFMDFGTFLNYDYDGNKLWDYTLSFNGQDGLFERFWRSFDNLLRNSLIKVPVKLLLDDATKFSLTEYKKVSIQGEELLPDCIKYPVDKYEVAESTFYTTRQREPLSTAILESARIPVSSKYKWVVKWQISDNSKTQFNLKDEPTTIFYNPPTSEQYNKGGKFHVRTYDAVLYSRSGSSGPTDGVDGTVEIWLEPALK
jgi:hypothetical protein